MSVKALLFAVILLCLGCLPTRFDASDAYIQYLKAQGRNKEKLPPLFKKTFQIEFPFDIDDVSYAERV